LAHDIIVGRAATKNPDVRVVGVLQPEGGSHSCQSAHLPHQHHRYRLWLGGRKNECCGSIHIRERDRDERGQNSTADGDRKKKLPVPLQTSNIVLKVDAIALRSFSQFSVPGGAVGLDIRLHWISISER